MAGYLYRKGDYIVSVTCQTCGDVLTFYDMQDAWPSAWFRSDWTGLVRLPLGCPNHSHEVVFDPRAPDVSIRRADVDMPLRGEA